MVQTLGSGIWRPTSHFLCNSDRGPTAALWGSPPHPACWPTPGWGHRPVLHSKPPSLRKAGELVPCTLCPVRDCRLCPGPKLCTGSTLPPFPHILDSPSNRNEAFLALGSRCKPSLSQGKFQTCRRIQMRLVYHPLVLPSPHNSLDVGLPIFSPS